MGILYMKWRITLIIPAKNESESLPTVLTELGDFECKIIIVLDKNDIETINSIKQTENIKIIFQKSEGYGAALIDGIECCETDLFCIFNADGSFNPNELQNMYNKLRTVDFVFASRYQKNSGSEDDNLITLIGNYVFTKIGNIFFKLPITDILYTYVMGETKKAKSLGLVKKDFSYCVELPIKIKRNKMNLVSSPSYERKRIAGKKKVNAFFDGYKILKSMVFLYFSK